MRIICQALCAVMLACIYGAGAQAAVPVNAQQIQMSFAPLVKQTSPAVVNIYTKRVVQQRVAFANPFMNDPFFSQFFGLPNMQAPMRQRMENSLGSGVIVDSSGLVATNRHVIQDATEITVVMSDGREWPAENVLTDARTDLAVLRIKGVQNLPALPLANSDTIEVGDLVLAIGNPFGVGQTVTSGIISAVSRTVAGPNDFGSFIQTDAAINPGNSGGALINMRGELIGINSMIFSKDGGSLGIGFAIPSNLVATVIRSAQTGNRVLRPWSGFSAQSVTSDMLPSLGLDRPRGALITRVMDSSPAERAGLRPGDVVLRMDDRDVTDPQDFRYRLETRPIGQAVALSVRRGERILNLTLITAVAPEKPPRDTTRLRGQHPLLGATVINISPAASDELGPFAADKGVVVIAVEGAALGMGVQVGDIVQRVNGQEIGSVKDLVDLLSRIKTRRWQIELQRGDQTLNLMATL